MLALVTMIYISQHLLLATALNFGECSLTERSSSGLVVVLPLLECHIHGQVRTICLVNPVFATL